GLESNRKLARRKRAPCRRAHPPRALSSIACHCRFPKGVFSYYIGFGHGQSECLTLPTLSNLLPPFAETLDHSRGSTYILSVDEVRTPAKDATIPLETMKPTRKRLIAALSVLVFVFLLLWIG